MSPALGVKPFESLDLAHTGETNADLARRSTGMNVLYRIFNSNRSPLVLAYREVRRLTWNITRQSCSTHYHQQKVT